MTPSLPGPNGLVFKFYSYWYYDQEGYHVGDPVATKPQAIAKFPGHFKKMEVSFDAKTILIRCDMEATIGKDAGKAITRQGINTLPTAAGTPAQNGASEVAGREIVTKSRTLRIDGRLPKTLWLWLMDSAVYLLNRTPTAKLNWMTPFEKVTTKKPFLSHLHPIGCKAFALRRDIAKRDKIEERAHIGYLIGYASTNIFWIWIPSPLNKVIRTRDVVFKDNERYNPLDINGQTLGELVPTAIHQTVVDSISMPEESLTSDGSMDDPFLANNIPVFAVQPQGGDEQQGGEGPQQEQESSYPTPPETPARDEDNVAANQGQVGQAPGASPGTPAFSASHHPASDGEVEESTHWYSVDNHGRWIDHGTGRLEDYLDELSSAAATSLQAYTLPNLKEPYQVTSSLSPPANWKEMERHIHYQQFRQAAFDEAGKLMGKRTFRVFFGHKGHKVPLVWVFAYKTDPSTSEILRYKARLCVRGDLQLPSTHETYAATPGYKVFRAITALAFARNLKTR